MPFKMRDSFMELTIFEANVVVLGAWNPRIITPEWLMKQNIVPAEPNKGFGIGIGGGGRFEFRFGLAGFSWLVDHDRLVLSGDKGESPTAYVRQVMQRLSHTPVHALGFNFKYRQETNQGWHPILTANGLIETFQATQSVLKVGWDCSLESASEFGKVNVNVKALQQGGSFEVYFNFHRPVGDAERAIKALELFENDRATSREFSTAFMQEVRQ